jgi:hypothetical protein
MAVVANLYFSITALLFTTPPHSFENKIMLIFEYLKQLEKTKHKELEYRNRQQIGYKSKKQQ